MAEIDSSVSPSGHCSILAIVSSASQCCNMRPCSSDSSSAQVSCSFWKLSCSSVYFSVFRKIVNLFFIQCLMRLFTPTLHVWGLSSVLFLFSLSFVFEEIFSLSIYLYFINQSLIIQSSYFLFGQVFWHCFLNIIPSWISVCLFLILKFFSLNHICFF